MRRYGRRSRFRTKSSWVWADQGSITLDAVSGTPTGGRYYTAGLLLPPGRTKWLCDNTIKRSHMTVTGILLWMDFRWRMTSEDGLPNVEMFIDTTAEDDVGNITYVRDPFFEPQVPSLMGAWTDAASDGLDGYMWCHHILGSSPPNCSYTSRDAGYKGNQATNIPGADSDHVARVCRKFNVSAEWQPDVHVKTKRRLRSDEGLIIGMSGSSGDFPNANVHADLFWAVRILGR